MTMMLRSWLEKPPLLGRTGKCPKMRVSTTELRARVTRACRACLVRSGSRGFSATIPLVVRLCAELQDISSLNDGRQVREVGHPIPTETAWGRPPLPAYFPSRINNVEQRMNARPRWNERRTMRDMCPLRCVVDPRCGVLAVRSCLRQRMLPLRVARGTFVVAHEPRYQP
jgi:hypothetical protein